MKKHLTCLPTTDIKLDDYCKYNEILMKNFLLSSEYYSSNYNNNNNNHNLKSNQYN